MSIVIVPHGSHKIFPFVQKILETNIEYTNDDITWLMELITKNYNNLCKNANSFYTFLTLINMKLFCGYFAHIYNYQLIKYTKERNDKKIVEIITYPVFEEINNNDLLTDEEFEELNNTLTLEAYVTNFTLKRVTLNEKLLDNLEKAFEDSYNELYTKVYSKSVSQNRAGFQDFLVVTEYNNRTKTNHAYTYKLIDILIQCYNQSYSEKLSDFTIQNLCDKFEIELKIIENNMQVLAKI